ncbi:MAG: hypothetical protein L0Y39_00160 [Methylococcaceae bacterium]|nr:hypothetical protein [Methylococcaceae bacterium]
MAEFPASLRVGEQQYEVDRLPGKADRLVLTAPFPESYSIQPETTYIFGRQPVTSAGYGQQFIALNWSDDLPETARHHADIFTFYLNKGEALLLAIDGLWSGETFAWPAPDASVTDLQVYVNRLAQQAMDRQSDDNVTVLMLRCQ